MITFIKNKISLSEILGSRGISIIIGIIFMLIISFSFLVNNIFGDSKNQTILETETVAFENTVDLENNETIQEGYDDKIIEDTLVTQITNEGHNSNDMLRYVIQSGDTLSSIATMFAVKVEQLISYNNLSEPNVLYPNQVLNIPINGSEKTYQVISKNTSLNSNSEGYLLFDLTEPSNLDEIEINRFLKGTNLAGLGSAFKKAEEKYRVNAKYLMAHAIHESDWGRSKIAIEKNNLFGYKAYDKNPYGNAMKFNSMEESIDFTARFISNYYLKEEGKYYNGPTLIGMNKNYATSKQWASKIADLMNRFDKKIIKG